MASNFSNAGRAGRASAALRGCAVLGAFFCATAAPADQSGTAAQWHAQDLKFVFTGFTSRYSCDGLEQKVRDILLTFGARQDAKVRATGCMEGLSSVSRNAWVEAKFSALMPVTDPRAGNIVASTWTKVQIAPNQPSYMGAGECELVEQMRELLQKGFNLRNADYRTSCFPYHVSLADYGVTAEVLRAIPQ